MKIAVAALALASFLTAPVFAADATPQDAGNAALTALGEINGIALACKQPAIVSQARNAVATSAPKTRINGEIFESATNAAFLAQGQGLPCPDAASLAGRLRDGEKNLSAAFASQ